MISSIMQVGRSFSRIHDALSKMLFYAAAAMLFFMAFTVSYEVAVRYFFNKPTLWVMDLSEYILIYSTFMAAPWLLKIGGHVSVTAIVDTLYGRQRLFVELLSAFIGIVVCAVVAYNGILDTLDVYRNSIMIVRPIMIPKYTIYWIIPFGLILVMIYFIRDMIESAHALVYGRSRQMDA